MTMILDETGKGTFTKDGTGEVIKLLGYWPELEGSWRLTSNSGVSVPVLGVYKSVLDRSEKGNPLWKEVKTLMTRADWKKVRRREVGKTGFILGRMRFPSGTNASRPFDEFVALVEQYKHPFDKDTLYITAVALDNLTYMELLKEETQDAPKKERRVRANRSSRSGQRARSKDKKG